MPWMRDTEHGRAHALSAALGSANVSPHVKQRRSPRQMALLIGLLPGLLSCSIVYADVDWRAKGAVTSVRNQGEFACNLSWAFAVAGLVEGASAVQTGTLPSLSPQQLIDCASTCKGSGGLGSCPDSSCAPLTCAFNFITANGMCSLASYPYTGPGGSCTACTPVIPAGFAANWIRLAGGEAPLVAALNEGPVLARLEIGLNGGTLPSYLAYSGGVFAPPATDATVVQWVLVVGYTGQFFIVKNSLGTGWGSSGYLSLVRGQNALGVGNVVYALKAGARVSGACALPDGSCMEVGASDCASAGGTFGGVGTFCAVPCSTPVPILSREAVAALILLLALTGLVAMIRRSSGNRPTRG